MNKVIFTTSSHDRPLTFIWELNESARGFNNEVVTSTCFDLSRKSQGRRVIEPQKEHELFKLQHLFSMLLYS